MCQVTHASEHMRAQLAVVSHSGHVQRPPEVPACLVVTSGVMGHPTSHLGQCRSGGEHCLALDAVISAEQSGCNVAVEVANDRGVQMPAADLAIR